MEHGTTITCLALLALGAVCSVLSTRVRAKNFGVILMATGIFGVLASVALSIVRR